jgi:hypothetical protein
MSSALKTERCERRPVEIPMARDGDRYVLDFDAAEAAMDPSVRILIFCAPQNPSGRVWTADELRAVAEFAARHDLIVISDEIHSDLIYPGAKHVPMVQAAPEHADRIITINAASKTFGIPGLRTGYAIIPDPDAARGLPAPPAHDGIQPRHPRHRGDQGRLFPRRRGMGRGADDLSRWQPEALRRGYQRHSRPRSMPLQSTFLAWVDFAGTGMTQDEVMHRVRDVAKIGVNPGPAFGPGGEMFNRFNFAMRRELIEEAVARMQDAFSGPAIELRARLRRSRPPRHGRGSSLRPVAVTQQRHHAVRRQTGEAHGQGYAPARDPGSRPRVSGRRSCRPEDPGSTPPERPAFPALERRDSEIAAPYRSRSPCSRAMPSSACDPTDPAPIS